MADAATGPGVSSSQVSRFGSLRTRLIASHALVILLALALVLAISAVLLRRDERRAQIEELKDLALPLLVESRTLGRGTAIREQALQGLLNAQAAEIEARILVLDANGQVQYDTAVTDNLDGQVLTPYLQAVASVSDAASRRETTVRRVVDPSDTASPDPFAGQIVLLAAGGQRLAANLRAPDVLAFVAEPRSQGVARRFLPPLLIVVAVALGVASLVGYLLSRRIAAPVTRLTEAADAMAAGRLEQTVSSEGSDEIGRLVASFNAMSRQVAATSRSQRQLLANIAHELRTPLTSVQGYTQALRDGLLPNPDDVHRTLATISSESDRMARLISQLLDLSRLESGQVRLESKPVAISELFARIQSRFQPEARQRGIALLAVASTNPVALGDDGRLDQILTNLVANALRYTPSGGEVVLAAVAEAPPHGVHLTVRDTGAGISPEQIEHIFDRFQRGADDGDGFGLGLAIVRELVELHSGTISVASRLNSGTTFTIDLPAA